jgi:hypothetical protein
MTIGEQTNLPRSTGVLYALCKFNSDRCEGYLTGVADILLAMGNSHIAGGICNAEYDSANLRKVFVIWVERHPDNLQHGDQCAGRFSRTMALHVSSRCRGLGLSGGTVQSSWIHLRTLPAFTLPPDGNNARARPVFEQARRNGRSCPEETGCGVVPIAPNVSIPKIAQRFSARCL